MLNTKLLNKQSAKTIRRLSLIVSALTLVGAAVIFFFVQPPPWSFSKVEAVVEQRPDLQLVYPSYSFSSNRRIDIFKFGNTRRNRQPLIKKVPKQAAYTLPGPNATGLTLLATLPGRDSSYCILKGLDGSGETVVSLGEKIRDSLLAKVDSDSIVLTRNAQNMTLLLNTPWRAEADNLLKGSNIPIKGSYAAYAYTPSQTNPDDIAADTESEIRDLDLFMVPLTEDERKKMELTPDIGLRIIKVTRSDLDVMPGDLLVAASGKPVGRVEQVLELLQNDRAGDLSLTLIRKGKPINVRVAIH